jgi:hypothetical protein
MKKVFLGLVAAFLLASGLTGCASLSGSKSVAIDAYPAGTSVVIYDAKGNKVEVDGTFRSGGTVTLPKTATYTFEASKENYAPKKVTVKPKFNHLFWGNFLLAGVGVGVGSVLGESTSDELFSYSYFAYGIGAIGVIGIFYDIFTGSLQTMPSQPITFSLEMTPEGLAQQAAQQTAQKQAEVEKKQAEAEANELKRNPKGLDRSQYKEISVEDFTFDMVAGNLKVGTRVCFEDNFLGKPTGTEYRFNGVNALLTLSSTHNFVRDIPESYFTGILLGRYIPQFTTVTVYVTVTKTGEYGTGSVDIVEW